MTDLNQLQTITPSLAAAGGLNIYTISWLLHLLQNESKAAFWMCSHHSIIHDWSHFKGKGVISRKIRHEFTFWNFTIQIQTLKLSWKCSTLGWLDIHCSSCRPQRTLTFWVNYTFMDSFQHNPMSNDLTKIEPRLLRFLRGNIHVCYHKCQIQFS